MCPVIKKTTDIYLTSINMSVVSLLKQGVIYVNEGHTKEYGRTNDLSSLLGHAGTCR